MLKRIAAGVVLLPAAIVAFLLAVGGIAMLVRGYGAPALGAAVAGLLGMPGIMQLYRTATARDAPSPAWWAWVTSFGLIAVPLYFLYGFVHFYGTKLPMQHARSDMRVALETLAEAQREYRSVAGTFAPAVSALDTLQPMRQWPPNPELTLEITHSDSTRWSARAEHPKVTFTCTITARVGEPAPMSECSEGKLRR